MAQRKRIGLIFSYNEGWIAGSYYIQNLIYALRRLPDPQKPELVVLCRHTDLPKIQQIGYPYLSHFETGSTLTLFRRIINKACRWISGRNAFEKRPPADLADVFFPMSIEDFFGRVSFKKAIFWIPDFQEYHLPHFFTDAQLAYRRKQQSAIVRTRSMIVFSSSDAESDFKRFFPHAENPTHVLPFAVTHEPYQQIDSNALKSKYGIKKPYYFSPNQFWKHKNHIVVLKAIRILASRQPQFQVVFTGREFDNRNPTYFQELKSYVKEHALDDYVRFLGFIDRKDQLQLMNHSMAVVQPSLFEGWSTVVEDAKAMSQFVFLSDIKVHREQMQQNVEFFNPLDEVELAEKMIQVQPKRERVDYDKNVLDFGCGFVKII